MDQDGIEFLVIEVVDVDTVCGILGFPVHFDIVLRKYLFFGLRDLIADPLQPIGARAPVGMKRVPRRDINIR